MLALLGWLGAQMFWALSAKETSAPPPALETEPRRAAQAIVVRHLFGEVPSGPAVVAPMDIKLTGVIAAARQGETGMAFLAIEGKPAVAIREGGEVVPGIALHRVLPKQVELARGGQILVLALPEQSKGAGAAAPGPIPQAVHQATPVTPETPRASRRRRRVSSGDEE